MFGGGLGIGARMLGGVLGLLTVGAALFAGRGLAYLAGERRPFVGAAVGVALLELGIYGWGRATQDLVVATGLTLLTAVGIVALAWRAGPPSAAPGWAPPRLGVWGWLGVLAILVLGGHCIFHGYFWDEYSCHYPLTASLARGVVPAEFPLFPGEQFRYHYGFDLLAGAVRALTGLDVAWSLDVVSFGLLALLLGVARDLGASLGGRRATALMPTLLLMGTGTLVFTLFADMGPLEVRLEGLPARWRQSVPPPTISNFFQHPQGLGMPLALATLMLFDRPLEDPLRKRRTLLGAFVMAALSLAQIVFFGVLGLVLGLVSLGLAIRARRVRPLIFDGLALAGSLVAAFLIGGFLAPGPPVESMLRFGKSFFVDPPGLVIVFHLVVFGAPLIALPFALVATWRRPSPLRLSLAVAAVFGFLVPHFATYERSWDIVKFLTVGAFFANALFVDLLDRWPPRRAWAVPAIGAIVLVSTLSSWIFLLRFGVIDGKFGISPMHFPPPSEIGRVTAERLEPRMVEGDQVFSTNTDIGSAGGLPTPGFPWRQVGIGFMLDRPRAEQLHHFKQIARRSLDPEALRGLDVQWMALSSGDRAALDTTGRRRLADPERFTLVDEVQAGGQVRYVYRVEPGALE